MMTLQEKLNFSFRNVELLRQALTHRSYSDQNHNEKLEFIGDAVLGLALAEALMRRYPNLTEGELSKIRASFVNEAVLAELAREFGIDQLILMSRGEMLTGGAKKPRLLASAFEALIGAAFFDAGYEICQKMIEQIFSRHLESLTSGEHYASDFKSRLQEVAQARFRSTPVYRVIREEGPDHDKTFHVEVLVEGRALASGVGKSKKMAEQQAAQKALETL